MDAQSAQNEDRQHEEEEGEEDGGGGVAEDGGKPVAHGEAQIAGGRSSGQNGDLAQKLRPVVHAPGAQAFALLDGGGEGIGQVGFDADKGEVGVVGQEAGNRFPADGDHLVGAAAEGEGGAALRDGERRVGAVLQEDVHAAHAFGKIPAWVGGKEPLRSELTALLRRAGIDASPLSDEIASQAVPRGALLVEKERI